jgi:RimJ/RimL family protein N-acetyltransferase
MPNFKFKPTLTSRDQRIQLRPFAANDADRMLDILAQPMVNLYTGALATTPTADDSFPADAESTARIRDWYATRSRQSDRLDLAIIADGQLVGEVVLNLYQAATNEANLRILIADDATGHGIGTTTFALLLPYAFLVLGLDGITLDAFTINQRAIHVYHKVGFTDTGILPGDLELDGHAVDSITMRLTRTTFLDAQAQLSDN